MRGASKQRVGYKNTNVLRKSLRKRPRLGSRQTGVRVRSGLEGWAQVGGKLMQIRSQTSLATLSDTAGSQSADQTGRRGAGLGSRAGGGGPGAEGRGSLYVLVRGMGLRPAVLKCMSAAVGSGRVHAAAVAAAAAVVLKRTAPECLAAAAAAAATPTRRRRGPAAPARGRRGPGGGRRQLHRLPALPAAARLGPEPAARAGASTLRTAASPPSPSARRLSGHPRSPLHGRKRVSRGPASSSPTPQGPPQPNSQADSAHRRAQLPQTPPLPAEERPSFGGFSPSSSQSKPARHLSSPASELLRGSLQLQPFCSGAPSPTLTATEPPPQTEAPAGPSFPPTSPFCPLNASSDPGSKQSPLPMQTTRMSDFLPPRPRPALQSDVPPHPKVLL